MKRCSAQGKVKLRDAGAIVRWLRKGDSFRLYQCPHCGFLHMTTKGKP